jgi:guanylate kinase
MIIKNAEILELVSLFEDAYGAPHSKLEEKLQERGGERL